MLNASSQLRVEELETELARARSELSVTTKQLTELSAKLAKIESERDNLRRAYQPRSQSGRIPAFSMTGTRLLTLRRRIHVAKAERIDPCQLELELHETQKKLKELAAELEQQAGEGIGCCLPISLARRSWRQTGWAK